MSRLSATLVGILAGLAVGAGIVLLVLAFDRERLIESCDRVNVLRVEVTDLAGALVLVGEEAAGFARDAEAARRREADTKAADKYAARADAIDDALAAVDPPDEVGCRERIPLIPIGGRPDPETDYAAELARSGLDELSSVLVAP